MTNTTAPDNEKEIQISNLARSIMDVSRNTLLVHVRYLDRALEHLALQESPGPVHTDGRHIFYEPVRILRDYRKGKTVVSRTILHMILHCILSHIRPPKYCDPELWDLSCDIAVENIINEIGDSAMDSSDSEQEEKLIDDLLKNRVTAMTAEKIYYCLRHNPHLADELLNHQELFHLDDHSQWYADQEQTQNQSGNQSNSGQSSRNKRSQDNKEQDSQQDDTKKQQSPQASGECQKEDFSANQDGSLNPQEGSVLSGHDGASSLSGSSVSSSAASEKERDLNEEMEQKFWQSVSEEMQSALENFSQQGTGSGSFIQSLKEVNREKWDYTKFLKQFAVNNEVMKTNEDEFDYIYYTLGMNLYGNIPMIEPLEYKEAKQIEDFVIAIDTSGSVQGDQVQAFIQKTYNILKQEETFLKKVNIHIIQCDADIQEDVVIHSQQELDDYLKHMKIKGFGGTDFRPVFDHVQKLIDNKQFRNLKGLLYFTDGYGTFPQSKPPYKTAFIFVDDEDNLPAVPPWAIRLVLSPEELEEKFK